MSAATSWARIQPKIADCVAEVMRDVESAQDYVVCLAVLGDCAAVLIRQLPPGLRRDVLRSFSECLSAAATDQTAAS